MAERDDLWQVIYEASPYNTPMPCKHFAHRQEGGWDVCAECEANGIYEAVIKHLTESGRLLPSGGEVETQYGCRMVDELSGERVARYVSQETAWAAVEHHRRIYATRGTYGGRAELVSREVHAGPWSPVVSDNSEEEGS